MNFQKLKKKKKNSEQKELELFLNEKNIQFVTTYHNSPVNEDDFQELRSHLEGVLCKVHLLYGQDKYFLAIFDIDTIFGADKLKLLAKKMGQKKLSFATGDTTKQILKCEVSYCSLFGILHDKDRKITEIWLDENLNVDDKVNFAPYRSDARITIKYSDMVEIIKTSNYDLKTIKLD